jgi:hypothetical protein
MASHNREGNPMQTHPLSRRAMTRAVVALILVGGLAAAVLLATSQNSASANETGIPRSVGTQLAHLQNSVAQLRQQAKTLFGHERSAQRRVTTAEKKLSYNQRIEAAKQAITEQDSLYGLLFNGNGPQGPRRALWGRKIFTGEGPFLAYNWNNELIQSQSFTHMKEEIADAVETQPSTWPDPTSSKGSMHYMFPPTFKMINLKKAVTVTPSMSVNANKNSQTVNSITIRVYHDVWMHTPQGWRKTESTWYRLD